MILGVSKPIKAISTVTLSLMPVAIICQRGSCAMMGVHHPVMSMEHQYFLTEDKPAIRDASHRMPSYFGCPISDYYCRHALKKRFARLGFMICSGVHVAWGMDGIDPRIYFVNVTLPR